jgi:3-oxoacyl-[acyl-carrier protein] reductase
MAEPAGSIMSQDFKDKIVVVSGASRGIGFAIAAAFARDGAQTVLAAHSADNLAKASAAIVAAGGLKPLVVAGDLRMMDACTAVQAATDRAFGRCDVLVTSAGATKAGAFLKQPDQDWHDGFALKFYSCVRLCRLFWPMLTASHGAVVNVVGTAARSPDPEFLVGGSVNAAVANFTKGLSALGKRDDVVVNAILPGLTETDRIHTLFAQRAAAIGTTPDEIRKAAIAKDGVSRLGVPEDSAELALFLASPRARHIQGTSIAVDGGSTTGVY